MVPYLTILALFALVLAVLIVAYAFWKQDDRGLLKYLASGFVVALADIIIEYLGTNSTLWTYHESIYHLLGTIPIELPVLFFSGGILAAFVYKHSAKIPKPLRLNTLFYLLMLFSCVMYIRQTYFLGVSSTALFGSVIVGLWGITNIKKESDRISAVMLAIVVAVTDFIVETIIIQQGGYSYATGFALRIPLTYGLLLIGLFGLLEKLKKLDMVLDYPIIKGLLKTFGVKRDEYTKRIKEIISEI